MEGSLKQPAALHPGVWLQSHVRMRVQLAFFTSTVWDPWRLVLQVSPDPVTLRTLAIVHRLKQHQTRQVLLVWALVELTARVFTTETNGFILRAGSDTTSASECAQLVQMLLCLCF